MTAHLIIPWREEPARLPLLEYLAKHWWSRGFVVTLGMLAPDLPWVKAAAVAAALEALQPADDDVLAIVDADVWTEKLGEAIGAVQRGLTWARPHDRVIRLNQWATESVLSHENPVTGFGPTGYEEPAYNAMRGGGITVLRYSAYQKVPLDPRFVGWGHEDEAWGIALTTLYGEPFELHEVLWHLWHPPQDRQDRFTGSESSVNAARRYAMARGDRDMMRMVINPIL